MKWLLFAGLWAPPALGSGWECEARIPLPGYTFLGIGATEAEARHDALNTCHTERGPLAICFVAVCNELKPKGE